MITVCTLYVSMDCVLVAKHMFTDVSILKTVLILVNVLFSDIGDSMVQLQVGYFSLFRVAKIIVLKQRSSFFLH